MASLGAAEVAALLRVPALVAAMERALADYSAGAVTQPVRTVVPASDGGFLFVMPAFQWVWRGFARKSLYSRSSSGGAAARGWASASSSLRSSPTTPQARPTTPPLRCAPPGVLVPGRGDLTDLCRRGRQWKVFADHGAAAGQYGWRPHHRAAHRRVCLADPAGRTCLRV